VQTFEDSPENRAVCRSKHGRIRPEFAIFHGIALAQARVEEFSIHGDQ
jgi:hypothetical protein